MSATTGKSPTRKGSEHAESHKSARTSPFSKSGLPEPYNAAEVLQALSARYDEAVEAANADKLGDKARVYKSFDSSWSWTTKGGGGKSRRDGDYSLLFEVNRSIHNQKHRKN